MGKLNREEMGLINNNLNFNNVIISKENMFIEII